MKHSAAYKNLLIESAYREMSSCVEDAAKIFTFLRHEIKDLFHAYRKALKESDVTHFPLASCHAFDEISSNILSHLRLTRSRFLLFDEVKQKFCIFAFE